MNTEMISQDVRSRIYRIRAEFVFQLSPVEMERMRSQSVTASVCKVKGFSLNKDL